MRHVPSVYFPIFICCSPVNITGIFLSLQKSCQKGIYLETSVASRCRCCCPHGGCSSSLPSALLSFLGSLQPSPVIMTGACALPPRHPRDPASLKTTLGTLVVPHRRALGLRSCARVLPTGCAAVSHKGAPSQGPAPARV